MKYLSLRCTSCFLGQLTAFIAGILLPFAFAPFNYSLLAIVSPALLLGLWFNAVPREAFLRGWWYGLGCFGVGVSWIYISIHDYGNTPVVVSGLFTFLFVAFLALFPAVQGYFLQWLFPPSSPVSRKLSNATREAVIASTGCAWQPSKLFKFLCWIASACKQRKPRKDGANGGDGLEPDSPAENESCLLASASPERGQLKSYVFFKSTPLFSRQLDAY